MRDLIVAGMMLGGFFMLGWMACDTWHDVQEVRRWWQERKREGA